MSDNEGITGTGKKGSPGKNGRKKPKTQLKGFALGFNAVLKPDPAGGIESIEERDEEFKTTGTQNVAGIIGAKDGVAADLGPSGSKKSGLHVETEYQPKSHGGREPKSGMNRGVVSPSLGTPGGALVPSSGLPSSKRQGADGSQVTDESEYDSEESSEEESEEEEEESKTEQADEEETN